MARDRPLVLIRSRERRSPTGRPRRERPLCARRAGTKGPGPELQHRRTMLDRAFAGTRAQARKMAPTAALH
jgi:hypothetical protein